MPRKKKKAGRTSGDYYNKINKMINPFNPTIADKKNPFNQASPSQEMPKLNPSPSMKKFFSTFPTQAPTQSPTPRVMPTPADPVGKGETLSQGGNRAKEAPSTWNKIARAVLPRGMEDYFGMNEDPSKPLSVQESENAKQSYWRGQRKEENIAGVTKEVDEYVPPTDFWGKLGEVAKYRGYTSNVFTGFIKPAIGTVVEQAGLQSNNPELRKWGEQFADRTLEKESRRSSAQSMADVPGVFEGGLKDPRYYSKTMTQAVGFLTAILGTSVAVTAVTKNPVLGATAAFSVGAALESSGAYQDMIDSGVAPDDANTAAQIYGVAASMIENATGIKPMGGVKALTQDFAVDAAKNGSVKSFFKTWAQEGILEEGSQQMVENIITKFVDKDRQVFDNVLESMVSGSVGALPAVGGGAVYNRYKNKKDKIIEEDIMGPDGKPLTISHFTDDKNINSILSQGFDTSRAPIHGIKGLEAGEATGKFGNDTLYFTTDNNRWNKAQVFVGEGKGTVSQQAFNYETQQWETEENAYKMVDLAPIESTIKDEAKILTVDSVAKAEEVIGSQRFNNFKFKMIEDLVASARRDGYDILNIKEGEKGAWGGINEDPTKTGYGVLTGNSGNDDYFVLNKDILNIKGAKQEEQPLDTSKTVGELQKEYSDTKPGYKKFSEYVDTMVQNQTVKPEEATILKTLFEGTKDDLLGALKFSDNGRLSSTSGRFIYGRRPGSPIIDNPRIQMQKGLDAKGFAQASRVFVHEFGHAGWHLVLTAEERAIVEDVFNKMPRAERRRLFSDNSNNADYYAGTAREFFAQSFSDYVFENKVSDTQMKPLLKRLAETFYRRLRNLVTRGEIPAVKAMSPVFEKILAGDKTTPLTEFYNKENISFKEKLQEIFDNLAPETKAQRQATGQKPLFTAPATKEVPVEEIMPKTGDSAAEMGEEIRQKGTEGLPPDIASTVEPLEKVIGSERKTPLKERVRFLDYLRTPWKVFDRMGIRASYQKLLSGYEGYVKELPQNIDKITAWSKRVSKESNEKIFRSLDGETIALTPEETQVAGEIRTWLAEWADRLGMSKDERISEYITHIFPIQKGGEIPEEISYIINKKIPGSVYNPFLLQRKGAEGYKKDTWAALDAYTKRATRKVHMDPALTELKEASAGLTDTSQLNYLNSYLGAVNLRPTALDTSIDNHIKEKFGYFFGARPTAAITRSVRKMIARAKIGGSITSLAKNLTQGVNTFSDLGTFYTLRGYMDLVKFGAKELKENGVLIAPFIEDRTYSAVKKTAEKVDKVLFANMNASELVNRGAAYYGAKAKFTNGKVTAKEYKAAFGETKPDNHKPTQAEAVRYGKFVAAKTQFLFGALDTPVGLNSDIAKMAFQFQTFGLKQAEFITDMVNNKEWLKLTRYMASSMFLFQFIAGAFGMKWDDSFKTLRWGMPPAIQFFIDLFKGGIMGKDKYGNRLDGSEQASLVAKTLFTNMVPVGSQLQRSYQGLKAVGEGAGRTKSGTLQYKIDQTPSNYVRGTLFGKYNLPENKKFYKEKDRKARGKSSSSGSNPFNPQ